MQIIILRERGDIQAVQVADDVDAQKAFDTLRSADSNKEFNFLMMQPDSLYDCVQFIRRSS